MSGLWVVCSSRLGSLARRYLARFGHGRGLQLLRSRGGNQRLVRWLRCFRLDVDLGNDERLELNDSFDRRSVDVRCR
jgi:hypothetical protein